LLVASAAIPDQPRRDHRNSSRVKTDGLETGC
jgi:hypothetical protein